MGYTSGSPELGICASIDEPLGGGGCGVGSTIPSRRK